MKKKRLLLSVLALGAVFSLASCDDKTNEKVKELEEQVSKLTEEKNSLTTENTTLKNDKTTLTNENNTLKTDKETLTEEKNSLTADKNSLIDENTELGTELDRLSTIVYPNKDNTNCKISLEELNAISDISKISNDKDVIVKTYDIDDELLSIYKISLGENDTIFDKFVSLADVEYKNESWGAFITSIDGSIKDDKYYNSIYVNDNYANNGIEGLDVELNDGDIVTFKSEFNSYSNPNYDEVDIKVDKIIYNYYKHAKEYANKIGYVDYNLAFAYKKLQNEGYNVDTKSLYSNSVISRIVNDEDQFSNDNKSFKTALAYYCAGLEGSDGKLTIFANRDLDIDGQWNETNLAYYYNVSDVVDYGLNDHIGVCQKLEGLTLSMDETSCMIVTALNQIDSTLCQNFDQTLKPGFTEKGFSYTAYGFDTCNCSSTAQAILAFGAIGKNIRNNEYKVNNTDMIQALLSYYDEETGLFYDYDGDMGLNYATPQAVSALISYKLLKAGKSSNIYEK